MTAPDLSLFSLEGKVALVTGGSRGIGYGIAMGLARAGADVCVASRDLARCQQAASEIAGLGRRSLALQVDVSQPDQVETAVADAIRQLGCIDILVNNAGIADYCSMVTMSDEQWQSVLDVNLNGVFYCSRAVVRHMLERGAGGNIINIASMGSYRGWKGATNYCASKAGVEMFTKTLALEVAEHGIRVNAIAPGSTETDINAQLRDPEVRKRAASKIPLNKVMMPEDFAGVAIFLASAASSMITGFTIAQDGGWLAYLP